MWKLFCASVAFGIFVLSAAQSVGQGECVGSRRRIRRNVNSLSSAEKERLQKALRNAIASTIPGRNYKDVASIHGAPLGLCGDMICAPHQDKKFLPWHRLYTVQMEQLLNISLPYWDWTETDAVPDLWEGIAGPFKEGVESISNDCVGNDKTHHRRASNINLKIEELKGGTRLALEETNFIGFWLMIEEPHNWIHEQMRCDMLDPDTAAYDPVFYLHHAYVDYQFAFWQELQKLRKIPRNISEEFLNTVLEPFNRTHNNPFPIILRNSRVENTFNYTNNLCYEYDTLKFNGMTPAEFQEYIDSIRHKRKQDTIRLQHFQDYSLTGCNNNPLCRVFVGIILPKNAPTSRIEFQICTMQNRCVDAGRVATFGHKVSQIRNITNSGTSSSRSSSDYYLVEYEVTDTFQKDSMFDGDLTARISAVENPNVIIGLDPVMIWRNDGGVERGTAYLSHWSKKEDYGTLLDKFDNVRNSYVRL